MWNKALVVSACNQWSGLLNTLTSSECEGRSLFEEACTRCECSSLLRLHVRPDIINPNSSEISRSCELAPDSSARLSHFPRGCTVTDYVSYRRRCKFSWATNLLRVKLPDEDLLLWVCYFLLLAPCKCRLCCYRVGDVYCEVRPGRKPTHFLSSLFLSTFPLLPVLMFLPGCTFDVRLPTDILINSGLHPPPRPPRNVSTLLKVYFFLSHVTLAITRAIGQNGSQQAVLA
jgi:hypothetical protein